MFCTCTKRFTTFPGLSQHGLGDLDVALDREHTDGGVGMRLVKRAAVATHRKEERHLQMQMHVEVVVERTQARVQGVHRGVIEVLALLHAALVHGLGRQRRHCTWSNQVVHAVVDQEDVVQVVVQDDGDERKSTLGESRRPCR